MKHLSGQGFHGLNGQPFGWSEISTFPTMRKYEDFVSLFWFSLLDFIYFFAISNFRNLNILNNIIQFTIYTHITKSWCGILYKFRS